jgi:hypothetical protein
MCSGYLLKPDVMCREDRKFDPFTQARAGNKHDIVYCTLAFPYHFPLAMIFEPYFILLI